MGWHEHLLSRLTDLLAGRRVDPPPSDAWLFKDNGTANFRAMAWAGEYLRAYRYDDVRAQLAARKWATLYFTDQANRSGHMSLGNAVEQTCPDPHYNFHVVASAAIRIGALEFGHADILRWSNEWWRGHLALYRSCAAPDGQVFIPGLRCKGLPVSQVADMIVRETSGLPHIGPTKKAALWSSPSFAAAAAVRRLLESGDDLGGAVQTSGHRLPAVDKRVAWPYLRIPMDVVVSEQGHLARLGPAPAGLRLLEPCDWVRVRYDRPGRHQMEYGRDWKTPAPVKGDRDV